MFLYGKVPSGPLLCFCNLVLTKSNGKDIAEAKNPAIAEAVRVCACVDIEVDLSCDLASEKKAS